MLSMLRVVIVALLSGCATFSYTGGIQKEEGTLVVRVWKFSSLPSLLQKRVLEAELCDRDERCNGSRLVQNSLEECEKASVCKRSERVISLLVDFSTSSPHSKTYQIVAEKEFKGLAYGERVLFFKMSLTPRIILPAGIYSLKEGGWWNGRKQFIDVIVDE